MALKLIKRGKVKDIYEVDDERLLFEFTDRISAFDVILPSTIPKKGEVLCKFTAFWFEVLNTPNHMLEVPRPNQMLVKKLQMIPIEFIVRGYLYGSLLDRILKGEVRLPIEPVQAAELPEPVFDPTTKSQEKDVPITKKDIIKNKILTEKEADLLEEICIQLYLKMKDVASKAGFIIADVKFEFGKDKEGNILLADSIGPDEFRLWPKDRYVQGRPQESFDKQLVRDWLIRIGYKKKLEDALKKGLEIPSPPSLPKELVEEVTRRYIFAYEKITGRSLA